MYIFYIDILTKLFFPCSNKYHKRILEFICSIKYCLLIFKWAKIVVSLERAVSQKDAHNYLQEYSIKLGPGDDPNNPASEQRGVLVIKSKSKTRAKQRKGAVSNWKVIYLLIFILFSCVCMHRCISKDLFRTSASSVTIYLSASHSTDMSSGIDSRKMRTANFATV